MPNNVPKYKVTASHVGEVFGIDIADIKGKPHLWVWITNHVVFLNVHCLHYIHLIL